MSIVKEFKDFAMRGNVIDMAVGIIIGGGFGKIVASLVNDIIMPPIGLLIGGMKFSALSLTLKDKVIDAATGATITEAVTFNYGMFLQATVDFVILAFAIFMMIKAINSMKKQEVAKPAAPPPPSNEVVLLTEIRDLLKKK